MFLADKKNLEFEVTIDSQLPQTIYGDGETLSKVAINLLGNAIKFTEEGKVSLSFMKQGSDMVLAIKDTGIGIPPHAREFVFEEFRQVDQTSKRKYGGTGLGLAITQKLVRAMDGVITLDSEVGVGSTFTVVLPIHTETSIIRSKNMIDIPRDMLAGWNIVVIDDEEDSLEVAEIILLEYGASVYTASDGQQGLRIVQVSNPRLIISDMSMPVMDGWGFISAIKDDPNLSDIPVIALTAHAMRGDRERALEVGFHNYLTKPLTVETFMADLVKLLVDIPELVEHLNI